MNIILFNRNEIIQGIPLSDFRAKHILKILKLKENDTFSAGIINQQIGTATINSITEKILFTFHEEKNSYPLAPIKLVCGLLRPPVARRILKDCVTAGIAEIHFISVENGEKSYSQSKLWTTNDHQLAMLEGAQQGGTTLLPKIYHWSSVSHLFQKKSFSRDLIIMDNVTGAKSLSDHLIAHKETKETTLAIGAERGWTDNERRRFASQGFQPILLGPRIFRTETAIAASVLMTQNIKKI